MPREQTPRGINHWHKALLPSSTLHSVLNDGPDWAAGDSSSDVTPNAKLIGEIMHGRSRDDIPLVCIVLFLTVQKKSKDETRPPLCVVVSDSIYHICLFNTQHGI